GADPLNELGNAVRLQRKRAEDRFCIIRGESGRVCEQLSYGDLRGPWKVGKEVSQRAIETQHATFRKQHDSRSRKLLRHGVSPKHEGRRYRSGLFQVGEAVTSGQYDLA